MKKKNKINFIAEISSNHNGSIKRSISLINSAKKSGFSSVKFQLFKIEKLFSKDILEKSKIHQNRKKWELPISFIKKIHAHCKKINIKFGCTPFYLEAVDELKDYVDFFKISSYEILHKKLIRKCALTRKPLIISTGMATLKEVNDAFNLIKSTKLKNLTIMHCVSSYPAKLEDANLSIIKTLKSIHKNIGWSDHTVNEQVINRAIHRWGVKDVELHYDLDGKGFEFKAGHCWLPKEASRLIHNVNQAISSDGKNIKKPSKSELQDRDWRSDPKDGLRPMEKIRKKWKKKK